MPTLLDLLTAPNLPRISRTGPGTNTIPAFIPHWPGVWEKWSGFDYGTLQPIYKPFLDTPCAEFVHLKHSDYDLEILNENTFDHFLTRFNFPIINQAFQVTRKAHGTNGNLGCGSRCGDMDWAFVSSDHMEGGGYECLLPGDSKLHSKWSVDLYSRDKEEWLNPISQILGYMVKNKRRYGFIITDEYCYAFRITLEPIPDSGAADRPRRSNTPAAPVDPGHDQSVADLSVANLSITSAYTAVSTAHTESYIADDNIEDRQFMAPEYAIIPWSHHGHGKLTVNLALWCLAMMSMHDSSIETRYKPLDSWKRIKGGYEHNTSGVRVSKLKLPKGAVVDNGADVKKDPGTHGGGSENASGFADPMKHLTQPDMYGQGEPSGDEPGFLDPSDPGAEPVIPGLGDPRDGDPGASIGQGNPGDVAGAASSDHAAPAFYCAPTQPMAYGGGAPASGYNQAGSSFYDAAQSADYYHGGGEQGTSSQADPGGGGIEASSSSRPERTLYDTTNTVKFCGRDRKKEHAFFSFETMSGRVVQTRKADWRHTADGWLYEKSGKTYVVTTFPKER
ncbi:hypothetical protein RB595_004860 [Gaeumannomyces hyphopodioides]